MKTHKHEPISGQLLDEATRLHLQELCQLLHIDKGVIVEMVEYGILEPQGEHLEAWEFSGPAVYRVKTVLRLQHDLEVNLSGAAVIVEMLEELQQLRRKLRWLDQH